MAVVGVAGVLTAVWLAGRPTGPSFQLPDGTRIRVKAVKVARVHYRPSDPFPRRFARRLPDAVLQRFPALAGQPWSAQPFPTLACWLECERPHDRGGPNGGTVGEGPTVEVLVHDGRSFSIKPIRSGPIRLDGVGEGGFEFPAPPAGIREVTFDVRFRMAPGDVPTTLGSWRQTVRVPPPAGPVSVPDALPQMRTSDDLRVMLTDLVVGANPPGLGEGFDRRGWSWAVGGFRWEDVRDGSRKWRFNRLLECADPAGYSPLAGWSSDDTSFWWESHPWPDQPWRLRLEWVRAEGFDPGGVVTFLELVPDGVEAEVAACGAGEVVIEHLEFTANDGYLLDARATT